MEALWHTVWWNVFLKTSDTKPICVKAGKGNDHTDLVCLLISCKVFSVILPFSICDSSRLLCSVIHFDHLSQRDVSTSPCVDVIRRSFRNPRPSFASPQRARVLHWPKTFQCAAFSCDLFRFLHVWHPCTRVFHEVQRREDELKNLWPSALKRNDLAELQKQGKTPPINYFIYCHFVSHCEGK